MPSLLAAIRSHGGKAGLLRLLECKDADARKCAAMCVGLIGKSCCLPQLVNRLQDRDPMVRQMTENAMWSIWFRGNDPDAAAVLAKGVDALNARELFTATALCQQALQIDSEFGEAHNQLAVINYLQERFSDSIRHAQDALRLVPCHFGAWSGLGHCHCHLGNLDEALHCYRKALSIHPNLSCVSRLASNLAETRRTDA